MVLHLRHCGLLVLTWLTFLGSVSCTERFPTTPSQTTTASPTPTPTPTPAPPNGGTTTVVRSVSATQGWQDVLDVQVPLPPGITVSVSATGTWGDSFGTTDANGRVSQPVTGPPDVVPLSGEPIMLLVGRFGGRGGSPFRVGTAGTFTIFSGTGTIVGTTLSLAPNDRFDMLFDNFGSLTVTITVRPGR